MKERLEITDLEKLKSELFLEEQAMEKARENALPEDTRCPKCNEAFINRIIQNTSIEECISCKGFWLDYGELSNLISLDAEGLDRLEMKQDTADIPPENKEGVMTCPRCNQLLKEIAFTRDQNIKIDICEGCRGSFYDPGELTKCLTLLKAKP